MASGAPRARWELDDEDADHKLTRADRRLLLAGRAAAARSGALAGAALGGLPWVVILLARALLGGGWHFDAWVWWLTAYAATALVMGPLMGWLRLWSCAGHRFGVVPLAGVRAGWETWAGVAAIDVLVIAAVSSAQLGVLLLFAVFALLWAGLLYSMLWTALQDVALEALARRAG